MADIYFDLTSGDDTTGNGSLATPYKTLNKAVTMAAASGDTLILKNGTHTITADTVTNINKSVTITSESRNASLCIIDGDETYNYALTVSANTLNINLTNITFKDIILPSSNGILYIASRSGCNFNVLNCIFKNIFVTSVLIGSVTTTGTNNITTVSNCLFEEIEQSTTNSKIFGAGTGTLENQDLYTFNFYQNTLINNSNLFNNIFYIRYNTLNFKNNIFYFNIASAINIVSITVAKGPTNFYNTCYYNAGAGTLKLISAGSVDIDQNNITSNPLFVDVANGDYRLRPSSPCIDTGTVL